MGAKIYTIINNKGGTGKTTTVANLGSALNRLKKRVLLIDMDAQCNLSTACGAHDSLRNIGEVLLDHVPIQEAVIQRDSVDLIASTDKLLDFEHQANNEPGREFMLSEKLEAVRDNYDYILIDCPPSLSTMSINALVASDYYIVPMQAENFAFIGLDRILQVAEKVKKRMNPRLEMAGIVFTRHTGNTIFSQAIMQELENSPFLKAKLFKTKIRQDIKLMEATAQGRPIFEYMQGSRGAHDHFKLAMEIVERYG